MSVNVDDGGYRRTISKSSNGSGSGSGAAASVPMKRPRPAASSSSSSPSSSSSSSLADVASPPPQPQQRQQQQQPSKKPRPGAAPAYSSPVRHNDGFDPSDEDIASPSSDALFHSSSSSNNKSSSSSGRPGPAAGGSRKPRKDRTDWTERETDYLKMGYVANLGLYGNWVRIVRMYGSSELSRRDNGACKDRWRVLTGQYMNTGKTAEEAEAALVTAPFGKVVRRTGAPM